MDSDKTKQTKEAKKARIAKRAERRLARKTARQSFLRSFRWTVYIVFILFMGFVAVCTFIGIVTNLENQYPELDIPVTRPARLADLDAQDLRSCLDALKRLSQEESSQVQAIFNPELDRDKFLGNYKAWAGPWRKRLDKLGMTCRLNENAYSGHHALGAMADFYRRLDHMQKQHQRLTRRYAMENGRTLRDMHELMQRAQVLVEGHGTPPDQQQ